MDELDRYLTQLASLLGGSPDAADLLAEVEDHLREAAAGHSSTGATDAMRLAIEEFGDPETVARAFGGHDDRLPNTEHGGQDAGEEETSMFDRFTESARSVIIQAQEESRALWHSYIGTEHVLLGIVRDPDTTAARTLVSLGVTLEKARETIVALIGHGKQEVPQRHIPFTPRAKKVIELSLREALQLGHTEITPEHILLGLLREGEGVGAQVLTRVAGDLPAIRQALLARMTGVTDRERRVLSFLSEGKSIHDVAQELFVAERTVLNHLRAIAAKGSKAAEVNDVLLRLVERSIAPSDRTERDALALLDDGFASVQEGIRALAGRIAALEHRMDSLEGGAAAEDAG